MNKRNWLDEEEDFRIPKRELRKGDKTRKCPECGREIKSVCKDCEIVVDKKGRLHQFGHYGR